MTLVLDISFDQRKECFRDLLQWQPLQIGKNPFWYPCALLPLIHLNLPRMSFCPLGLWLAEIIDELPFSSSFHIEYNASVKILMITLTGSNAAASCEKQQVEDSKIKSMKNNPKPKIWEIATAVVFFRLLWCVTYLGWRIGGREAKAAILIKVLSGLHKKCFID